MGLGAEAAEGGFRYVIEELLRDRRKAGVYEFLVAWAGYEDQSWGKCENLPTVAADDYWARKEGSEDDEDDPEDPEDPPPPPVVVSERDLLASLIEDRIDDLRVFQEMARGALKKKASKSRAKPTRSQVKKAKKAPTEVSAVKALAMKMAKHKRVTVACAPSTWRSLLSMVDDGDARVTCIDFICVETLHEALGGIDWGAQRNAHTQEHAMVPVCTILTGDGGRAAVMCTNDHDDTCTVLPFSTGVQVQTDIVDIIIDEPFTMTYGCGSITMKGALFKVNTDVAEAVRVGMPEPADLTDEVAVWREVPALSNGPRN